MCRRISALAWALSRTRFGLRLRAVGENPHAVDTAGISVAGLRYRAVIIAGVLCGIAGAYLATGLSAGFVKDGQTVQRRMRRGSSRGKSLRMWIEHQLSHTTRSPSFHLCS